jgi:hypothetical protein
MAPLLFGDFKMTCVEKKASKKINRFFNNEGAYQSLQIGGFGKNKEVVGFNLGQFSSIDLVMAVLQYTGAAHCTIATWTAADADIQCVLNMNKTGLILSQKWIVDRSFKNRQPRLCDHLIASFGDDCIRVAPSHAKFVILQNQHWNVVIQTSMNLNSNKRIENFTVTDDFDFCESYKELVADVFTLQKNTEGFKADKHCQDVLKGLAKMQVDKRGLLGSLKEV